MDNRFKQQTVEMLDKHLSTLRRNLVVSVDAQREYTIGNLQGEYLQMLDMEKQIEAVAMMAVEELNRVHSKNVAAIHMLLSNLMAPITDRKLAIARKLNDFEDHGDAVPVEEASTAAVISLPAPKRPRFFNFSSKVKAAHG